jgi:16S rRNA (cytidine1402-2'-O)-methyltransferase
MENIDPGLYVLATPIGNLSDISLRALALLRQADILACEDTRHSRTLLHHHGIAPPQLIALHAHNERMVTNRLVAYVGSGKRVALLCDAGTPGISDPGARLCAAMRAAGLPVIPIPGPCAAIVAWSATGLSDERFLFAGFLPSKKGARRAEIERLAAIPAALILYEAPHRIADTLDDLARALEPARTVTLARELTKRFEQIVTCPIREAPAWLEADPNRSRGEFVLIISAPDPTATNAWSAQTEQWLRALCAHLSPAQAAKIAAEACAVPREQLYQRALMLAPQALS